MEIKPTYVPFEQAKLLKEKGFDLWVQKHYDGYSPDKLRCSNGFKMPKLSPQVKKNGYMSLEQVYYAPEQWQVIKWFEQFNLFINIYTEFYKDGINFIWQVFEYDINEDRCIGKKSSMSYGDNGEYKTREEAYSAAFDYILKKLI